MAPIDASFWRQLFVDDYIIEDMKHVSKRLNKVKKHPDNPLLKPELPWEKSNSITIAGVLYDEENLFRIWYHAAGHTCYATSKDGLKWNRPNLGLEEFEGSKENNITTGWGTLSPEGIIYSPEMEGIEPADSCYKTLCHIKGGKSACFSKDGFTWKPYENNPVITGVSDVNNFCKTVEYTPKGFYFKDIRGIPPKYITFPKIMVKIGAFARRCVSFCRSDKVYPHPFTEWSKPILVLAPDRKDDETTERKLAEAKDIIQYDCPDDYRADFYGMHPLSYEGIYLGLLEVFYMSMDMERIGRLNQDGINEVQLVSSRDLIHWERACNREPILSRGEKGEWDCGWINPRMPIIVGDEIWIYYNGSNSSHHLPSPWTEPKKHQVFGGLATLRLDGFVSIDAEEKEGELTTKLLTFQGNRLNINAQAKEGSVMVEILKENGRTVKGFDLSDCDKFSGDSVRHTVTWKGNADVSSLQGMPVKLRFYLKKAKLYSFHFQN